MRRLSLIAAIAFLFAIATGCGEQDDAVQWGSWQSYPDEDSTGEIVQGPQWTHEPEYRSDTPRQFRYITSRDVDAFVAPIDNCNIGNALEQWSEVDDFHTADYSDRSTATPAARSVFHSPPTCCPKRGSGTSNRAFANNSERQSGACLVSVPSPASRTFELSAPPA